MKSSLRRLRDKKQEIDEKKRINNIFTKIENTNNQTIYHTKILQDFYAFGIDKNNNDKFFLILRELFKEKLCKFHLFSTKDDDKFLGIHYGYRKPIKNIVTRYEKNGITKTYTFSKVHYIEFRFKKGSVFCYVKGIYYFFRKEKSNTKYCKTLLAIIQRLERQVYEFYNKKLPDGGVITKWIKKNLK
ncbi:DUF226 domain-containing protein [Borrelia puertoricensis]|uniref:DUF226 domain-containing protein n=1 Tax=Borrelia puertoricensis TaxID=2756107 RepID=UPI001FF53967|nr:DUF226 domain-containing protein [Borrelia puertoricensis]UPA19334.1 DUF226 domain-containing protein [Borrelia puertoricensis]